MKVLWVVNVPLPEASLLLNEKPQPFGGWLINSSKYIVENGNIELSIAFPKSNIKRYEKLYGKNITYYAFKEIKDKNKKYIKDNEILKEIINDFNPDLIHIYGTEMAHTISTVNICEKENVQTVISIQGLVSICAQHIYANLPFKVIYGYTLRNILRKDSILAHRKLFEKRGKNEIQSIKKTNNIIGRTTWDKACVSQINSNAKYYFCNETLREEFYNHIWEYDKCEKYSIFLSQGQYPIKGLHYALNAMPIILKKYPQAKLYISGKDIIKTETLKDKLLITRYGKYIKMIIKKLNLENNVIFTGPLDEREMCKRYLKANVFVCPSSIENSPNSLGEAMLLGLPCVSSSVGGVTDMIKDKKEGFIYQADAPYMLAYYICEIFKSKALTNEISKNARLRALKTHDRILNNENLIKIYKEILDTK